MAEQQLARGLWTGFASTENPFGTPNGMDENLRTIDDHIALYTLLPVQPAGTALPVDAAVGDGQIFSDGSYAVFNANGWKTYGARKGIFVLSSDATEAWQNTGSGWKRASVVDTQPAIDAAAAAIDPLVVRAENAATAAALGIGTYYTTIEEGRDAVSDGQSFWVEPNLFDGLTRFTMLKRLSGTTQEKLFGVVSESEISPVLDGFRTDVPGYAYALIDRLGQIGLSVTPELFWSLHGVLSATLSDESRGRLFEAGADILNVAGLKVQNSNTSQFMDWCDNAGNVFLRFDTVRGQIYADPSQDFADRLSPLLDIQGITETPDSYRHLRDYIHIWVHGQSLSVGSGTGQTISGISPFSNVYMPSFGLLDCASWSGGSMTGTESGSSALVQLDASVNSRNVEVPGPGVANQFAYLSERQNLSQRTLVSHSGRGGYAIRQLDKTGTGSGPTQPYQLAVNQANTYRVLANSNGRTFGTAAMVWVQGETDISQGTDVSEYISRLLQLRLDYAADTGQEPPVLFTYQVASHTRRTPNHAPDIGIAQWQLSRDHDDVVLVCPMYQFDYVSDGVHLPAHESRRMGCYFGKAIHQTLVLGRKFRPLEPVSIVRQGAVINVDYFVPVLPLVLDTAAVSDPGQYGFEVFSSSGEKLPISSVSVEGARVRIVMAAVPSGPVDVGYAIGSELTGANAGRTTGARGCLRDSDPTVSWATDVSGARYKLYNWSVMFKFLGV